MSFEYLEKGIKAAKISALIILGLSVVKVVVAFLSGSVALLAGSANSFLAVFSSFSVWVGLRVSLRKPTERFPYGYFKAETFTLLLVSIVMIVLSFFVMGIAFEKIFVDRTILYSEMALFVTGISAVVFLWLARHKSKVGREIGSQALISEGFLAMVDFYTSILVFAGVLLAIFGFGFVEGLIGFFIGFYVLYRGVGFGKDASIVLMDASPSPSRVRRIRQIAEAVEGVRDVGKVRLRKSGPVYFGEMHAELEQEMSIEKVDLILEEIEKKVKNEFNDMESVLVHVGTTQKEKLKVCVPLAEDEGWDSRVTLDFWNASYFGFVDVEKGEITGFEVKLNSAVGVEDKKGLVIVRLLLDEKVDVVLARDIFVGLFHVLRDNFVQIYKVPNSVSLIEAVNLFRRNSLEKINSSMLKM